MGVGTMGGRTMLSGKGGQSGGGRQCVFVCVRKNDRRNCDILVASFVVERGVKYYIDKTTMSGM